MSGIGLVDVGIYGYWLTTEPDRDQEEALDVGRSWRLDIRWGGEGL